MKKLNYLPPMLSIVFAITCFAVSVSAQALDDRNQIATANGLGTSVRFDVKTTHAGATLTVVGPDGEVFTNEFQGGNAPEFRLTNKKGERLPDGQYVYELRLTPVFAAEVKGALKTAREKGTEKDVKRDLMRRGQLPSQPMVQSGAFQVVNGTIIVAGMYEEGPAKRAMSEQPAAKPAAAVSSAATGRVNYNIRRHHPRFMVFDQVIPDDLIVQGSICVGFDCVNGENFGFDTIRLKENNLRIGFDDTSVGAFPSNNWEIRANDTTSGGANFLGFADMNTGNLSFLVEAGAIANALRVSSSSNIGLGTATPALDIHANTSDTPAIRLEQNNSGGFSAQTWDIGANEANFFIRDLTGGSRLSFRIRPGAPTSSIDISANGNVGVGTASPRTRVDIKQTEDSFIGGLHLRRAALNDTWGIATGNDNNLYFGYANDASLADTAADFSTIPLILTANNRVGIGTLTPDQRLSVGGDASKTTGGSWLTLSDRRLKNIKAPFTTGLDAVMKLQPIRFEYRDNTRLGLSSDRELVGFSAQSVQEVVPEAVRTNSEGYLMVNNDPIIWTMLNAIKEQQKEIVELKRQVRQLRATQRRRK
jgi:Chaperone of endosialidase